MRAESISLDASELWALDAAAPRRPAPPEDSYFIRNVVASLGLMSTTILSGAAGLFAGSLVYESSPLMGVVLGIGAALLDPIALAVKQYKALGVKRWLITMPAATLAFFLATSEAAVFFADVEHTGRVAVEQQQALDQAVIDAKTERTRLRDEAAALVARLPDFERSASETANRITSDRINDLSAKRLELARDKQAAEADLSLAQGAALQAQATMEAERRTGIGDRFRAAESAYNEANGEARSAEGRVGAATEALRSVVEEIRRAELGQERAAGAADRAQAALSAHAEEVAKARSAVEGAEAAVAAAEIAARSGVEPPRRSLRDQALAGATQLWDFEKEFAARPLILGFGLALYGLVLVFPGFARRPREERFARRIAAIRRRSQERRELRDARRGAPSLRRRIKALWRGWRADRMRETRLAQKIADLRDLEARAEEMQNAAFERGREQGQTEFLPRMREEAAAIREQHEAEKAEWRSQVQELQEQLNAVLLRGPAAADEIDMPEFSDGDDEEVSISLSRRSEDAKLSSREDNARLITFSSGQAVNLTALPEISSAIDDAATAPDRRSDQNRIAHKIASLDGGSKPYRERYGHAQGQVSGLVKRIAEEKKANG